VYFTDIDSPELNEAWTLDTFVKFDAQVRTQQTLIGRPGSWFIYANLARQEIRFVPRGTQNPVIFKLPASLAGSWHMISFVKNNKDLEFFIDGKSQGKQQISDELATDG